MDKDSIPHKIATYRCTEDGVLVTKMISDESLEMVVNLWVREVYETVEVRQKTIVFFSCLEMKEWVLLQFFCEVEGVSSLSWEDEVVSFSLEQLSSGSGETRHLSAIYLPHKIVISSRIYLAK